MRVSANAPGNGRLSSRKDHWRARTTQPKGLVWPIFQPFSPGHDWRVVVSDASRQSARLPTTDRLDPNSHVRISRHLKRKICCAATSIATQPADAWREADSSVRQPDNSRTFLRAYVGSEFPLIWTSRRGATEEPMQKGPWNGLFRTH